MAARLRPAKGISNTARGSACRRGRSNSRDTGQLSLASELAGAARTCARKTVRNHCDRIDLSKTPALDSAACWLGFCPDSRKPAIIPFRSIAGDLEAMACAGATAPGGRDAVTDPAKCCRGVALGLAWGNASGTEPNTYCA